MISLSDFRLVDPAGRQMVVADDAITITDIPGVEAVVNRVDEIDSDEAGPAYVEVQMRRPSTGAWKLRALVPCESGASLTAYAENDSLVQVCDCIFGPSLT
jgi:hypothetical protein